MKLGVLLVLTALSCLGQSNAELFPVGGTVVDGVSGRPLGRVRVVLSPSAAPRRELRAEITGADGRFRFEVPQGKYSMRAERPGLPPQPFGTSTMYFGFGIAIVTGPGQDTADLSFRLAPPAAISGRVVDEAGDPVERATVQLLISAVQGGRKRVVSFGWKYTNDQGEYRFGHLPAGEFYLAVTGKPWYAANSRLTGESAAGAPDLSHVAFAPAYYADAADARSASALIVQAGQEAVANFALYPKTGSSLKVSCESCGQRRMRLDLTNEGILGTLSSQRVVMFYGETTVPGIPPGHYQVRVSHQDSAHPVAGLSEVDVTDGDVSVSVAAKEAPVVSGTVVVADGDAAVLPHTIIGLNSEPPGLSAYAREVASDGTFQVPVTTPGAFRLRMGGSPGVFVRQVMVGDAPTADGLIHVGAEDVHVRVVAGNGVGKVKGLVMRNGRPLAGVLVVLAQSTLPPDPSLYYGFLTDSDGSFDFTQVRPGAYRLFPVDDEQFEYANPAAVKPHMANALEVRVEPHGQVEQNIDLP